MAKKPKIAKLTTKISDNHRIQRRHCAILTTPQARISAQNRSRQPRNRRSATNPCSAPPIVSQVGGHLDGAAWWPRLSDLQTAPPRYYDANRTSSLRLVVMSAAQSKRSLNEVPSDVWLL